MLIVRVTRTNYALRIPKVLKKNIYFYASKIILYMTERSDNRRLNKKSFPEHANYIITN